MPITKSKTPNEFLVRWSDAGVIQGAHIVFREAIAEDGTELSSKMLPAQPVSLAGEAGFPLADVLDILQTDALGTIDAKDAEIATLKADAEKAKAEAAQALSSMTAERDAAVAQAAALQAQIDAAAPPVIDGVPQVVTMRQARLALLGAGKLALVDAAIDSMPEPQKSAARIEWEYSNEVQRSNGFVAALGPALGMTDEQIDQLFIAAAKL